MKAKTIKRKAKIKVKAKAMAIINNKGPIDKG